MARKLFLLSILLPFALCLSGQGQTIRDSIALYFQEVQANTDHWKDLWDLDIYGPILVVNQTTRQVYANYPDGEGVLKQDGPIFTGTLPNMINVANTATTWGGKYWAMITLPLSQKKQERLDLFSHELFHRSQGTLGFAMKNPDNSHLDQKYGRVYLRLEIEALRQAYISKAPVETKSHLTDALIFRKYRYILFPDAATSENLLELNEGIASYTGIVMSNRDDQETEDFFDQRITEFQHYPSFVRSFAYMTTPLYGYILRRTGKYWNKQIKNNTNLTDFFLTEFNISLPKDLAVAIANISDHYGSEKIVEEETKRDQAIKQRIADYKSKFTEQPHLEIYFEKMNISFDPRNIIPLENLGNVYPTLRISDNWGILTVTDGALVSSNWGKVTLSIPTEIGPEKIEGNGWSLVLNNGYSIEKNSTTGNFLLKKQ
jgi:hypothetical protein